MTAAKTIQRRLLWKELRQLWPLGASLVVLGIFSYLLYHLNMAEINRPIVLRMLIVGLPSLFAVGVGALLVGQEKDQRTLLWLSSLPIAKQDLIRSKLIAGLISLIVIWMISLLLATVFSGGEVWSAGDRLGASMMNDSLPLSLTALSMHSLYLLLAGLALAWRFKSAYTALVWLVPFAFIPFVVTAALLELADPFMGRPDNGIITTFLVVAQLVSIAIVTHWGWRNAVRALDASGSGRGRPTATKLIGNLTHPHTPASALLWQFAKQNTIALRANAGLLAAAAFFASVAGIDPTHSIRNQVLFGSAPALLAVLLTTLSISWLGTLAFQSDLIHRRIRFLADRGVSPAQTWLSRHAIPVCVIGIGLLVILPATTRGLSITFGNQRGVAEDLFQILLVSILFGTLTLYAVSQWVGQLFPSPIVATVTSPAIAFGLTAYLIFAASTIGTPLWLLLAIAILPLLTTFVLTRHWMDCRYSLNYWLVHVITLTLFLLLPVTPLLYPWLTQPKMSATIKTALAKELESATRPWNVPPLSITLKLPDLRDRAAEAAMGSAGATEIDASSSDRALAETSSSAESLPAMVGSAGTTDKAIPLEELSIARRKEFALEYLLRQTQSSEGPIYPDFRVVSFLRIELELARLKALSVAENKPTEAEDSSKRDSSSNSYEKLLNLAISLTERTRQSTQLFAQNQADDLEIMLLWELQQIQDKRLVKAAIWNRACELLSNRSARQKARRLAIAAEWWKFQTSETKQGELVSAVTPWNKKSFKLADLITLKGRVGQLAEKLWLLSDASNPDSTQLRQELASLQGVPQAWYGVGEREQYFRADRRETFMFETSDTRRRGIGTQWNAGWEQQANQLVLEPTQQETTPQEPTQQ